MSFRIGSKPPGDENTHEYFMGPIAASDHELAADATATMIRLTYHLANAKERDAGGCLVEGLSNTGRKEHLPPRASEYATRKNFVPIWEAERGGRDGERPGLPVALRELVRAFTTATRDERAAKTQQARMFFDSTHAPGSPPDGRRPSRDEKSERRSIENIAMSLERSIADRHLTPREVALARAARGSGAAGSNFLTDRIAAHTKACQACRDVADMLMATAAESGVLAEAQRLARSMIADSFDDWAEGKIKRAPLRVEERMLDAAAEREGVNLQFRDTQGRPYSLCVREVARQNGSHEDWTTEIGCAGDPAPNVWEFRLTFRPQDEERALERRGLHKRHLDALFASRSEDDRECLLDLLLPCRYGSNLPHADPCFAEVLNELGVPGRLPGIPSGVTFNVIVD